MPMRPPSSQIARSHRLTMALASWLTNSTVPRVWKSRRKRMHFWAKNTSPTDSASSTTRMSASAWAITANASRTYMPLE